MEPAHLYAVEEGKTITERLPVCILQPGAAHDFQSLPPLVGLSFGYAVGILSKSGHGLVFVDKNENLSFIPHAESRSRGMTMSEAAKIADDIEVGESDIDYDLIRLDMTQRSAVYEVMFVLRRVNTAESEATIEQELLAQAREKLSEPELKVLLKHYGVKTIEP